MTGIPSVSTMKVLHEANERGIPLYTVTKDNIKDVLEILEVGQAVKNGYNEFCNDGRIIIIPEKIYNITVGMERDI